MMWNVWATDLFYTALEYIIIVVVTVIINALIIKTFLLTH